MRGPGLICTQITHELGLGPDLFPLDAKLLDHQVAEQGPGDVWIYSERTPLSGKTFRQKCHDAQATSLV